jgi:hypothetical protein
MDFFSFETSSSSLSWTTGLFSAFVTEGSFFFFSERDVFVDLFFLARSEGQDIVVQMARWSPM